MSKAESDVINAFEKLFNRLISDPKPVVRRNHGLQPSINFWPHNPGFGVSLVINGNIVKILNTTIVGNHQDSIYDISDPNSVYEIINDVFYKLNKTPPTIAKIDWVLKVKKS